MLEPESGHETSRHQRAQSVFLMNARNVDRYEQDPQLQPRYCSSLYYCHFQQYRQPAGGDVVGGIQVCIVLPSVVERRQCRIGLVPFDRA